MPLFLSPQRRHVEAGKVAKLDEQIADVERQRNSVAKTSRLKKLRHECAQALTRYA
ncbi:MAG: hypothetical protein INR62_03995 [Rhodospirillales bacterium]|nr:hypothetical protein [Acetobacter sp.]